MLNDRVLFAWMLIFSGLLLVAAVAGMWDAARAFGILGLVCAVLWQAAE
jgi:hypothetical protein